MGKVGENGVLGIENGFTLQISFPFDEEDGMMIVQTGGSGHVYAHPGQVLVQKLSFKRSLSLNTVQLCCSISSY